MHVCARAHVCVCVEWNGLEWNITQPFKIINNTIYSNIDKPRDDHTKQSKLKRERQILYDFTYMWNLKYDTNEHIYKTETDSET